MVTIHYRCGAKLRTVLWVPIFGWCLSPDVLKFGHFIVLPDTLLRHYPNVFHYYIDIPYDVCYHWEPLSSASPMVCKNITQFHYIIFYWTVSNSCQITYKTFLSAIGYTMCKLLFFIIMRNTSCIHHHVSYTMKKIKGYLLAVFIARPLDISQFLKLTQ